MKCSNCSNDKITASDKFCPLCGSTIKKKNKTKKIVIITLLILFFVFILYMISLIMLIQNVLDNEVSITALEFENYMEKHDCYLETDDTSYRNAKLYKVKEGDGCHYNITFMEGDYKSLNEEFHKLDLNNKSFISNSYYSYKDSLKVYKVVTKKNSMLYGNASFDNEKELTKAFSDLKFDFNKGNLFFCSMIIFMIILLISIIFLIVVYYKIFKKVGLKGWYIFIPFYNIYSLISKLTKKSWVKFLLIVEYTLMILYIIVSSIFLNPYIMWLLFLLMEALLIIYYILYIFLNIKMTKSFGYSVGYAVGLILIPVIFLPIFAFDDNKYLGIKE